MRFVVSILLVVLAISCLQVETVEASEGAEVFDIKKGEIILTIENTNALQTQAREWISSVSGIAGSLNIEPSDGLAIKILLTPPYKVNHEWIKGTVK